MSSQKKKINPWGDDHPEKFSDSPKTIGWNQQLKNLVNPGNMLDQMFGSGHYEAPHEPHHEKQAPNREVTVFSRGGRESEVKINQETEMLLHELKKQVTILEKQGKGLVKEIAKIKVEQMPPKKGIYYLRYLEWLITLVKQMRMKIEDGQVWLQEFQQNKKKKQGYWQKYKKHGTTFGLSNERSLATQTG